MYTCRPVVRAGHVQCALPLLTESGTNQGVRLRNLSATTMHFAFDAYRLRLADSLTWQVLLSKSCNSSLLAALISDEEEY